MSINQLKAGAILNYIVIGLNMLVGVLYTPYMLRMLGPSDFGLYSLVASVIAYLTIMDFGFGNAIIRYTAKFRAEGKTEEQYSMFGMFIVLYSVIGLLAFCAGLGLYFNVDTLFGDTMTDAELSKARIMMLILSFNLAVTFPFSIFSSIITAYENFVFQKSVNIVRIILNTVVMIALLHMGYKAIAMVVVQTVFNLLTLLLNLFYCRWRIKIKVVFGRFQWGFLREVAVYSFWVFLAVIMDRLYWSSGQFVLGATSGTAEVAIFSVAIQLKIMFYAFSTAIAGVFLPKVTAMISNGAFNDEISSLFIRVGRIQYIILAFILTGFILLGRPFVNLWAGENYDEAYPITLLFMVASLPDLIQNIGITILMARNELKYRSILLVCWAIIGVVLSFPFSHWWGPLGCAIAISIGFIGGQGLMLNIYYKHKIGLNIPCFWSEILKMSVIPFIFVVLGGTLLHQVTIPTIGEFVVFATILTLLYIPLFYLFSMNSYERKLIQDITYSIFHHKK